MNSGSNINNNIEFKRKGNSKYSKYAKNNLEFEKIIAREEDYSSSIIDLSKEESSNDIEEIINLGSQESQHNKYEYGKIEDSKKSNNKNEDDEPLYLIDSNSMSNERNDNIIKTINPSNNKTINECKNIDNKIYPNNNILNNENNKKSKYISIILIIFYF